MGRGGKPGLSQPPFSPVSVNYIGKYANNAAAANAANTVYGGLVESMWYWDTTLKVYKYWNGTTWVSTEVNKVEFPIFDWLLFNGAVANTLNGGVISTSTLPKLSQNCGIQFKVDLYELIAGVNLIIQLIGGHSTLNQTLNLNLDCTVVNPGENFNTKAAEATINGAPVTPGVAYQRFTHDFVVPHGALVADGSFEGRLSRNVGGADTGDLDVWQLRAFQLG